jgi:hypothetical protein
MPVLPEFFVHSIIVPLQMIFVFPSCGAIYRWRANCAPCSELPSSQVEFDPEMGDGSFVINSTNGYQQVHKIGHLVIPKDVLLSTEAAASLQFVRRSYC